MPGIVVGYDSSPSAASALEWAMRQACAGGSPLTVLTVSEISVSPWTGNPSVIPADRALPDQARLAAQDAVAKAEAATGLEHPPPVTVKAVAGIASRELIDAAADADLLVLGSRGRPGFPALRISDTFTKVAHYSHCPVVMIPAAG